MGCVWNEGGGGGDCSDVLSLKLSTAFLSRACCTYFSWYFLKGSVQRKLRWVKNGVNKSVGASDCGAGHSFVVLFGFLLGFVIFPFPISTAQIKGEFWNNR
jgi:hypothetical protein